MIDRILTDLDYVSSMEAKCVVGKVLQVDGGTCSLNLPLLSGLLAQCVVGFHLSDQQNTQLRILPLVVDHHVFILLHERIVVLLLLRVIFIFFLKQCLILSLCIRAKSLRCVCVDCCTFIAR